MATAFFSRSADFYTTIRDTTQEGRRLILVDQERLLDAFRDEYDFRQHHVIRGHIAARNGESVARDMANRLRSHGVHHAFTGLAAAWFMTHFATFRLVTVYLHTPPTRNMLSEIGFRPESKGANTWLILPKDPAVFQGEAEREGINCVHPIQAYLDLKAMPERASEAAEELRSRIVTYNV